MTTHVISERFSAEEALKFFRDNTTTLSPDTLDTPVTVKLDYIAINDPEVYWLKLPPSLQTSWSQFRTPPQPRWWYVLDLLFRFPGFRKLFAFIRRSLKI